MEENGSLQMKAGILTNQLFLWEDSDVLAVGGGERVTLQLSGLLIELGYEVHVYQYSSVEFHKKQCILGWRGA